MTTNSFSASIQQNQRGDGQLCLVMHRKFRWWAEMSAVYLEAVHGNLRHQDLWAEHLHNDMERRRGHEIKAALFGAC
ncbi:MAG: hypothetical protein KGQ60_01890 [Planctomycetes bacterium]|nr:hypothetical protein [Planctomycetota bacterium]